MFTLVCAMHCNSCLHPLSYQYPQQSSEVGITLCYEIIGNQRSSMACSGITQQRQEILICSPFFFFPPHLNLAGLLLLWNLRSIRYQEKTACSPSSPARPLPSRLLACRTICVCLTNLRRESRSRHSSSCKAFWNEGFKTHLF